MKRTTSTDRTVALTAISVLTIASIGCGAPPLSEIDAATAPSTDGGIDASARMPADASLDPTHDAGSFADSSITDASLDAWRPDAAWGATCGDECRWCEGSVCDDVVAMSAGSRFAAALRASGTVVAWGNLTGPVPVEIAGLSDAVQIAAGETTLCARRAGGTVMCFGGNRYGQLGNGVSSEFEASWVPVSDLSDAVEITTGSRHSCARRAGGAVVCWGDNSTGSLGDGRSSTISRVPVSVSGLTDAVEIEAGGGHTCARRSSGAVVCWGSNGNGELGDGTEEDRLTPTAVTGLTDAIELSAGGNHTCARRAGGTVVCWGSDNCYQLGAGFTVTAGYSKVPVSVLSLDDVIGLDVGEGHSCALREGGGASCWGCSSGGELGDGTTSSSSGVPSEVLGLTDAVGISAGAQLTCAVRATGVAVCFGANDVGQVGDGTRTSRSAPVPVIAPL